jgi:hypothetical protein
MLPSTVIFLQNHWEIGFGTFLHKSKARILQGEIPMHTRTDFGFYGQINHIRNIHKNFGIEIGMALGVYPVRHYNNILASEYDIPYDDEEVYTFYLENYKFHLSALYRTQLKKNLFLKTTLCVNLQGFIIGEFTEGANTVDENNNHYEIFFIKYVPYTSPKVGLQASVGLSYLFKHLNLLNINLIGNFCPADFGENNFYFLPDRPYIKGYTIGKFENKRNYLSLMVSYTFTRGKKMLKKLSKQKEAQPEKIIRKPGS